VHELAQLLVPLARRAATDGEDALHVRGEQALAQDALADHARCSKENDLHVVESSVHAPWALGVLGGAALHEEAWQVLRVGATFWLRFSQIRVMA
jgi:hypothetical protein